MGRQYPPASQSEESLFTFLDDKNFDTFRSFILFLVSHSFSVLTKTLGKPGSQTAKFLLRQLVVAADVTLEALYFVRTFHSDMSVESTLNFIRDNLARYVTT